MKNIVKLFEELPADHTQVRKALKAAKKETSPLRQRVKFLRKHLQKTKHVAVAQFAISLDVINCIILLGMQKDEYPVFFKQLKKQNLKLYNELADKLFVYLAVRYEGE